MVEKVSVACPNCAVRLRMPTYVRPGKKPKCPKCKTIVRPADVLPPELLAAAAPPNAVRTVKPSKQMSATIPDLPPVDVFAETKSQLFGGSPGEVDPYAETKTVLPDEFPSDDSDDDPPPWASPPPPPKPAPLDETTMPLPGEFPPP